LKKAGDTLQGLRTRKINFVKKDPIPASITETRPDWHDDTYQSPERSALTRGPSTKAKANFPFPWTCWISKVRSSCSNSSQSAPDAFSFTSSVLCFFLGPCWSALSWSPLPKNHQPVCRHVEHNVTHRDSSTAFARSFSFAILIASVHKATALFHLASRTAFRTDSWNFGFFLLLKVAPNSLMKVW